jgi:hypothetical protein
MIDVGTPPKPTTAMYLLTMSQGTPILRFRGRVDRRRGRTCPDSTSCSRSAFAKRVAPLVNDDCLGDKHGSDHGFALKLQLRDTSGMLNRWASAIDLQTLNLVRQAPLQLLLPVRSVVMSSS